MAYRARWSLTFDWIDTPGLGMQSQPGPRSVGASGGQSLQLLPTIDAGSLTFTNADVNAIMAIIATDMANQLATNLARIQGFATGGG